MTVKRDAHGRVGCNPSLFLAAQNQGARSGELRHSSLAKQGQAQREQQQDGGVDPPHSRCPHLRSAPVLARRGPVVNLNASFSLRNS